VPEYRRRSGVLGVHYRLPARAAADAQQQLRDCNLAREFDQRTVTATGAGTAGRTRLGHTASVDIAGGSVAADQKIVIAAASDGAAELRRRRPDYLTIVSDIGPVFGAADRWEYSGAEGGLLRRPTGDHLGG